MRKSFAITQIVVLLFFIHRAFTHFFEGNILNFISATFLLLLYIWFVLNVEWKEFQKMPVVGKYFKEGNALMRRR